MEIEGKDEVGNPAHIDIDLIYPEIYGEEKTTVELGICHTRAADTIRISYESERDGWIIEQASKFEWECDDAVCDRDWQEVAFIEAWARQEEKGDQ